MHSGRQQNKQQGFVYIALLIGLVIIGIGLGMTSEVWTTTRQREKEAELLFIGNQFRQAISRYYLQSPPAARRFPMTMDELVNDLRTPDRPAHFLRKIYVDPLTGTTQWGEVRLPDGQLVGVYSQSSDKPLKLFGFALRDKDLLDKERYSEWVFRSSLPAANPNLAAGAGYSASGALTPPTSGTKTAPTPRPDNAPPPPGVILPAPRR